jgi:hypothetical protein
LNLSATGWILFIKLYLSLSHFLCVRLISLPLWERISDWPLLARNFCFIFITSELFEVSLLYFLISVQLEFLGVLHFWLSDPCHSLFPHLF